jgi:CDP-4-dehydro-6-deoxyglucose reductase, E3
VFKVNLKSGQSFQSDSTINLVEAAKQQGVIIPHSCMSGRCNSCKIRVLKGTSTTTSSELNLSKEDNKNGYILACCRTATSDLDLECEDLSQFKLEEPKILPVKFIDVIKNTEDISTFLIKRSPSFNFQFLPGQYINLSYKGTTRSYSIANYNTETKIIELIIKNNLKGEMSKLLFKHDLVGKLATLNGPLGTSFLRNPNGNKKLLLIATGTGIAPIKAIIQEENVVKEMGFEEITVFWGMRKNQDLFWKPKGQMIKFKTILSREYSKEYVQNSKVFLSLDLNNTSIYACGSSEMISSLSNVLKNQSFDMSNLITDEFIKS